MLQTAPLRAWVGSRRHTGVLSALLVALVAFISNSNAELEALAQPVPEYSVKAGYLLLFARYVQWPDGAFASQDAPLVLVIVGRDPFGPLLDETFRDQFIGTHPAKIVRVAKLQSNLRAHIAFMADAQSEQQRWLDQFRSQATLTVGETIDAMDAGAIVRLVNEAGRIRFDVDWAAATRANLRILSPMLVSARQVRGAPAPSGNGVPP